MLLSILKILALLTTAALGVLGIFYDFRSHRKAAKAAMVFIPLVCIFGVAAEIAQYQQNQAAKIEAKRAADEQVRRILSPLRDLQISASVSLPLSQTIFASYRKRLDAGIDAFVARGPQPPEKNDHITLAAMAQVKKGFAPIAFWVDNQSSLWPTEKDGEAAGFLRNIQIRADFYRQPIPLESAVSRPVSNADLEAVASGGEKFWYELPSRRASLELEIPRVRERTNRILSVDDLPGCQIIVYVDRAVLFGLASLNRDLTPPADPAISDILKLMEIQSIRLKAGNELWTLGREDLKKMTDESGFPYYVYTFPPRVSDFPRVDLPMYTPVQPPRQTPRR